MNFLANMIEIWGIQLQLWMLILPFLIVAAALIGLNFERRSR